MSICTCVPTNFLFAISLAVTSAWASGQAANDVIPRSFTDFTSAAFVQVRHVQVLDRPLISSGTITLTDGGFTWAQLSPFENTLSFDGESILETTVMGENTITRPLQDPFTTNMVRTLYRMISGSWEQVEDVFEISTTQTSPSSWTLLMTPRLEEMLDVIPQITVSGEHFLEEIRVEQGDGGSTVITLSDHGKK